MIRGSLSIQHAARSKFSFHHAALAAPRLSLEFRQHGSVVPSFGNDLKPAQANVTTYSYAEHQIGFTMFASFSKRSIGMYRALSEIAQYLPPDAERTQQAMTLVTAQRKWTYRVGCDVATFVGKLYYLEKNILQELQNLYTTGQHGGLSMQRKNFKATLANLDLLAEVRNECLEIVKRCQKHGVQASGFGREGEVLQEAMLEQIASFGGSKKYEDLLQRLKDASEMVTSTKDSFMAQVQKLNNEEAALSECFTKKAVYQAIQQGEKQSLNQLTDNSRRLETEATQRASAAGNAAGKATEIERWLFGYRIYSYKDNRAAIEEERAQKLRHYVRLAKEDLTLQQDRVKKATAELASLDKEISKHEKNIDMLKQSVSEAEQSHTEAKTSYKELQKEAMQQKSEYGNISLTHIVELEQHLQHLPELLGAQGIDDNSMFAMMEGHLQGHEMWMKRMKTFVECENDDEALRIFRALGPTIIQAINQSAFLGQSMEPLKRQIEADIQQMERLPTQEAKPQLSSNEQVLSLGVQEADLW